MNVITGPKHTATAPRLGTPTVRTENSSGDEKNSTRSLPAFVEYSLSSALRERSTDATSTGSTNAASSVGSRIVVSPRSCNRYDLSMLFEYRSSVLRVRSLNGSPFHDFSSACRPRSSWPSRKRLRSSALCT